MKINIEINDEIWAKFKDKVKAQGKTLTEVTPTVVEPALKLYVDPKPILIRSEPTPEQMKAIVEASKAGFQRIDNLPIIDRPATVPPKPIPTLAVKRCELCDKVVDRLHLTLKGERACYDCWKGALAQ